MSILSLDAGLVSPGPAASNMDLYAFPGSPAAAGDGVAYSLWNNLWSVNYIFWYPFTPEVRALLPKRWLCYGRASLRKLEPA